MFPCFHVSDGFIVMSVHLKEQLHPAVLSHWLLWGKNFTGMWLEETGWVGCRVSFLGRHMGTESMQLHLLRLRG